MTTKYSRGPWRTERVYSDSLAVVDADGFEIVETTHTAILPSYRERLGVSHWARSDQAHRNLSDEEQEANSYLVAAAPEPLQALEALLDMDISYQRGPKVQEAEIAARLAVAKARGET